MKLAVLMAVYNNSATLKSAVNSILTQTFSDFQFLIVNDASTDDSTAIMESFRDKRLKIITNHRHLGLTKSLNKGLKQLKADYIARMDADDLALPQRLAKQINYLNLHPDVYLLGTAAYLINDKSEPLGLKRFPSDSVHLRRAILKYCPFIHPTWMFRRSALSQVGEYNRNFVYAQDYELALRIASRFKTANLAEPLLKYRVNSSQAISLKNLKKQEKLALKARYLAITQYNYPMSEAWKIIKPLLSFLVPVSIKRIIYQKFFWND